MLYGIAAAAASFLLAALLAALLRAPALRLGLADRRRRRPVPLLGGAAVVLATGLVAWAGEWSGAVPLGAGAGPLLVAATAVGALGLATDVWRLRRRWLLAGTAAAAACVVPYAETGPVAGALAVGWIALVTAAFRGLDHADGVAGTVGVVTAFGVGACAAAELMDGPAVLLLALAAALTGFLLHNWHPARIALGACGALFTGFLLAGAAVFARAGREPGADAGVLFALTAVPVADAVLVLLSRRLAGRPLTRGGPDHLAHRLRRLGLTPQGAVVVLGGAALCAVLVGVLAHTGRVGGPALLWVAGGAAAGVLGLSRVRVYGRRGRGAVARGTTAAGGGTVTGGGMVTGGRTVTGGRAVTGGGTATGCRAVTGGGAVTGCRAVTGGGAVTGCRAVTGGGTVTGGRT
ncbi:MraY family glycosyltransferase, partial [Streptomyces sp. NPDC044948]|uniref:MraY family glycosyltransferase n=1 Tax=Streptomyces sp. NPDC044948 TaxID=3157092 RepID=UPI00340895D3